MSRPITHVPSVSVSYARSGSSTAANEFGMRPMQERASLHTPIQPHRQHRDHIDVRLIRLPIPIQIPPST